MPQYHKRVRRGERLTVWIDAELYEALRARAFREQKSLSMLVGELLATALAQTDGREGEAPGPDSGESPRRYRR